LVGVTTKVWVRDGVVLDVLRPNNLSDLSSPVRVVIALVRQTMTFKWRKSGQNQTNTGQNLVRYFSLSNRGSTGQTGELRKSG
jgi:hypothetical protein